MHSREELELIREEAEARGWLGHDFEIDSPHSGTTGTKARAKRTEDKADGSDNVNSSRTPTPLSRTKKNSPTKLGDLLDLLIDEADVRLPPGFIALDWVGRQLMSNPGKDRLISELRTRGFVASRCHLDAKALRTNARMMDIVKACHFGLGIKIRTDSPFFDSVSQGSLNGQEVSEVRTD